MCIEAKLTNYIEHNVIQKNSKIGAYSWVRNSSEIKNSLISDNVFVGFRCKINNTIIGANTQIASNVIIGEETTNSDKVIIESGVWIGVKAIIDPGVKIGYRAIIGACSHVTEDVPANSIVVGRPAKLLRNREHIIEDGLPELKSILNKVLQRSSSPNQQYLSKIKVGKNNLINCQLSALTNVEIGSNNILIGSPDGPSKQGGITLGNDVIIRNNIIMEGGGNIRIGNDCYINDNVLIVSNSHDTKFSSLPWIETPVSIGNNVLIEKNVTIIGPSEIGDNVLIKENAVIMGKIANNSISRGIFNKEKEII